MPPQPTPPQWQTLNASAPDASGTFKLIAKAGTDIWRSSADANVFDAPAVIQKIKANDFKSLQATWTAEFKTLYDQAGLLMVLPGDCSITDPKDSRSWIKAGVEIFSDEVHAGVVATYASSDWSLAPLPKGSNTYSFKFVRGGSSMWVYVEQAGKNVALRQITWAFPSDLGPEAEIWVGVYAAKPKPDEDDPKGELEVEFKNVKLVTI